jgi:hypothetical protein
MSDIDLTPFLGRWRKTHEGPNWINSLEIRQDGGRLAVRVLGDTSAADWGESTTESLYAGAFIARFACDEFTTELQANVNLGLLVVAGFHRFNDHRANLFTREFFYQEAS